MPIIDQQEKSEIVNFYFWVHYPKKERLPAISQKEKRQNSKVNQSDLVKKVFVRCPGSPLGYCWSFRLTHHEGKFHHQPIIPNNFY